MNAARVDNTDNRKDTSVRKIINSTYITLDGVIQNPQDWPSLGTYDDAGITAQIELLEQCDAVLMGRHTYDVFAPAWSARSGDALSDRMNALPKYVVSSTLTDPQWNNTIVMENEPIGALGRMKQGPGANIVQYGFGALSRALMAQGLLDELRLWVHPFILGTGNPDDLLYRAGSSGTFTLADSNVLPNGIVILTFAATAEPDAQ